ncbi:phage holin family protein [Pontibaca salina]|uniref:Phage holin family protein n=1 Tax=Pontibaca salina TaxID=2795731 RepID=A0A934HM34_9RHOB|nr:phage holin family protein [Pontibaca salina]MBI6629416.1 phage holin family protein [Pontibaca salina]
MFARVEQKVTRVARKTALGTGAALALLVGIAFLTAAAWIYIAATTDTFIAALVLGAIYLGLGFVLLGLASSRERGGSDPAGVKTAPETNAEAPSNLPPLAQAFIYGIEAGAAAKRRKPKP